MAPDLAVNGSKGCLFGLSFTLAGKLLWFTEMQLIDLIIACGGVVTININSKTKVIVGSNPGGAELNKIKKYKSKTFTEGELMAMLVRKLIHDPDERKEATEHKKKTTTKARPAANGNGLVSREDAVEVFEEGIDSTREGEKAAKACEELSNTLQSVALELHALTDGLSQMLALLVKKDLGEHDIYPDEPMSDKGPAAKDIPDSEHDVYDDAKEFPEEDDVPDA